jgi:hypothetical protein
MNNHRQHYYTTPLYKRMSPWTFREGMAWLFSLLCLCIALAVLFLNT